MTSAEFISRGQQLYGASWQPNLARELARDIRTIRRWKTEESPIPKVVAARIRQLAAEAGREP